MRTEQYAATYDRLRREPAWALLRADNAAEVLGLLRHLLGESDRVLPASILQERLTTELAELRRQGRDLRGTANYYLDQWVSAGWVDRRLAEGAPEDQYELSLATLNVLRALDVLHTEREVATETRLSVVMALVQQLVRDTDPDPTSRLEALHAQKRAIERQIDATLGGEIEVLPDERAQERMREVLAQTRDVGEDFRRYGLRFTELYRRFREQVVMDDRSRGQLLADVFEQSDVIAESRAGKTFSAFWRLLTDPESMATLEASLDVMLARPFAQALPRNERLFLARLPTALLDGASAVANMRTAFSRSLRAFVVRREWQEHRRLIELLASGKKAALDLRDSRRPESQLGTRLRLTSATFASIGMWKTFEPGGQLTASPLMLAERSGISAEQIAKDILESDIDFRALADNLREYLRSRSQCSVGDLVEAFDAPQGLGTLLGYIDLGSRHGVVAHGQFETVCWRTPAGTERSARIPVIYFMAEAAEGIYD